MNGVTGLSELLDERDRMLSDIGGCGDGGCIVSKPKGMHTNGGCRCNGDRMKMVRYAYVNNLFANRLRGAISRTEAQDPS